MAESEEQSQTALKNPDDAAAMAAEIDVGARDPFILHPFTMSNVLGGRANGHFGKQDDLACFFRFAREARRSAI